MTQGVPEDRAESGMSAAMQAAAMHGIAINEAFPLADRLQAALQALAWYEAQVERLTSEAR